MNILCARIGSRFYKGPRGDTQLASCSRCGEAVWINPESREQLKPGDEICCIECFREFRKSPGVIFFDPSRR